MGDALAKLGPITGVKIVTFPDVGLLLKAILPVASEFGLTSAEGGVHAGEWEISMMLSLRPELVKMERAEPGYVGDLMSGVQRVFDEGVQSIARNGVFGDPRRASAAAGKKYVDQLVDVVVRTVEES